MERVFKKRKCEKCDVIFTPTGAKQRFCGNREEKTGCAYKHVQEWHGDNWKEIAELKKKHSNKISRCEYCGEPCSKCN